MHKKYSNEAQFNAVKIYRLFVKPGKGFDEMKKPCAFTMHYYQCS